MTNLIGRLPTPALGTSGDAALTDADYELELLERQLVATQSTHHCQVLHNGQRPLEASEVETEPETEDSHAPSTSTSTPTPTPSPAEATASEAIAIATPSSSLSSKTTYSRTYPRRRRGAASLMTLWARRGLLEEGGTSEQTRRMLSTINSQWDFNAFSFDRLTDGQNLATMCTYLFRELGLLNHFRLDALVVWKFFATVERHYHSTNPYHNGVHAVDVTQAMACFVSEPYFRDHLRPLETMASIIAAVGHDLDHPGLNEKFLIATSSHLAGLYNNSSVLENHHWRTCVALMHETGLAAQLNRSDLAECEDLIKTMVLATDISRQADFLKTLGHYLDDGLLDMGLIPYRHFMLQIALKCADISNPCRTWNVSRLWSYRACEEFYRQGDLERDLGLPVTPFCDRNNISVAKVQSTFYRYVAAPLFEEWHRSLASGLSASMLNNLTSNQARWDLITQQEARSATMAESVVSTSSSSGGGGSFHCESRRDSLDPPPPNHRLSRSSAEDGDEDSDPCTSYPYMPLDTHDCDQTTCVTCIKNNLMAGKSGGGSVAVVGGEPLSPRRHSLPPFLSDPLFRLYTSMTTRGPTTASTTSDYDEMAAAGFLYRQHSLSERRRSSAVQELRRQNSELLANLKLAQRRRLYAATNRGRPSPPSNTPVNGTATATGGGSGPAAIQVTSTGSGGGSVSSNELTTDENCYSNSANTSFNSQTRVTFHLGASGESADFNDADCISTKSVDIKNTNQQNTNLLCVNNNYFNAGRRRGSAPCNLLINQINKIANSAAKAATTASREHSPRGCYGGNLRGGGHMGRRRGSLPSDLFSLDLTLAGTGRSSRSSSGGPSAASRPAGAHSDKSTSSKKRKLLRRRSAGSGDSSFSTISGGSSGIAVIEAAPPASSRRRGPSLGKRGSLRSSSFGGVGNKANKGQKPPGAAASNPNTELPRIGATILPYQGRMSWHGKPTAVGLDAPNGVLKEIQPLTGTGPMTPRGVHILRTTVLSPSVEAEVLEEFSANGNVNANEAIVGGRPVAATSDLEASESTSTNSRRGSLPSELVLC